MNRKLKKIFEPSMRLYFFVLVIFAAATFILGDHYKILAAIECGIILILLGYSRISGSKRRKEMLKYIDTITFNRDEASQSSLASFPLPMVVFNLTNGQIISANNSFFEVTGEREHFFEIGIKDVIPDFTTRWLVEGKNECPDLIPIGDKKYKVFGNVVRTERIQGSGNFVATSYWMDVTDYARISDEYDNSRMIFCIITLDNYDEVLNGLTAKEKNTILAQIDDLVSDWTNGYDGHLVKYDRDHFLFLFEARHLPKMLDGKFSILDSAREIVSPKGVPATISIGIGKDGKTVYENAQFASLGIEMALSRGGDQAVIKDRFTFDFYGGHSTEQERHTKVKSRVMANSLNELIRDSSNIYVMGHRYADLDCIGAAVGICCIARKNGKTAHIVVDLESNASHDLISRICTLPEYAGVFVSAQEAMLEINRDTLLVVVDTNRPEQVESDALLMSCNHVAVIDHHRRAATYIQNAVLNFHEPYASSASELVAELLQYIVDQSDILRYEAEALLSGIVLDTKNFTLRTGGRTFDAAAFLRRAGADTSEVKRLLQSDFKTAIAKYTIIQKAKVYKSGIAVAAPEITVNRIIAAQAADELLNISGIQASFVVADDGNGINISGRSIGQINVQAILEKLGGGGNQSAAGAQVIGKTIKESAARLLEAIDSYLDSETNV